MQIQHTHIHKWKYSRNEGGKGYRRMVEGVNSSMIYFMCCKNFCKCHNVPPPRTTIEKKR
jgi:hypothetical protein